MKQGLYEQIINSFTRKRLTILDSNLYDIGIEKMALGEAL